jgi:hypothetical protein
MSIAETTKKRDIIRMLGTIVGSVAVMSVYGVGFTALVIADMIKRRATVYYGDGAEFEPSVYGPGSGLENVTCAPQWPPSAEKYYTDAKALSFAVQRNPFYHYMFCILCSAFLRWQGFFQPTGRLARITAGLVGCITLLAGLYFGNVYVQPNPRAPSTPTKPLTFLRPRFASLARRYTTYETIWANDGNLESQKANDMWNTLYITFVPLLLALFACQVCASPAKRKGKLMCRYVLFCMVEFVLERLYLGEYPVLNYADFFDESTTLFEKLLIRVVMHTVVTKMRIENVWQVSRPNTLVSNPEPRSPNAVHPSGGQGPRLTAELRVHLCGLLHGADVVLRPAHVWLRHFCIGLPHVRGRCDAERAVGVS